MCDVSEGRQLGITDVTGNSEDLVKSEYSCLPAVISRRAVGGGAPRHTSWESRPGRRRAASIAWGCVAVAITITPVDKIITNTQCVVEQVCELPTISTACHTIQEVQQSGHHPSTAAPVPGPTHKVQIVQEEETRRPAVGNKAQFHNLQYLERSPPAAPLWRSPLPLAHIHMFEECKYCVSPGVPSTPAGERMLNVTSLASNDGHPAVMVMSSPSLNSAHKTSMAGKILSLAVRETNGPLKPLLVATTGCMATTRE
ncbi:hypothetical protein E2C01_020583 [Portunus trituberculatus]|uniref:Uncharacterized protein n=1 Tax=Portunus trituberculatus TaxID=210409 RepID=A0A5B7E061_PORTR|nr:hypothetical protein [Portunus trituberculatus]